MGDSIGPNRTSAEKAILDCYGMSRSNPDGLEVYYTAPSKFVVEFPINEPVIIIESSPQFEILDIAGQISSNSASMSVTFSHDNLSEVYVRFRKMGGLWRMTTKDPSNVIWIGQLDSNTQYEYIIYGQTDDGLKTNSDLLNFTTL